MIKLVEASSLIVLRGYAGTKKFVSGHDALAAVGLVTAGLRSTSRWCRGNRNRRHCKISFKARVYNGVEINAQNPTSSMVASCDSGKFHDVWIFTNVGVRCCSGEDSCNAETGRNPAVPSEPSLSPKGVQTVAGADIVAQGERVCPVFIRWRVLSYPLDFRGRLSLKMSPTSSVLTLENPPRVSLVTQLPLTNCLAPVCMFNR